MKEILPIILLYLDLAACQQVESACNDRCLRCDERLTTCTQCQYGWYGHDCMFKCRNCWVSGCNSSGICDQCTPGRYREDCGSLCPINCGDDGYGQVFCSREDGTCLDDCTMGWWGETCNRRCNQHCDDRGCLQNNGHCTGDCSLGWWGLKCDRKCPDGCKNGCGSINSKCLDGCKDGFTSSFCNEPCPGRCQQCDQISGKCFKCPYLLYGDNCTIECGANCVEYLCNMQGRCTQGCIHGFRGSTCNETCPVNCLTCRQDGFICTNCKLGWTGSRCDNRDKEELELGPLDPSEDRTGQAPEGRELGQSAACTPQHVTWTTPFANFVITWIILGT